MLNYFIYLLHMRTCLLMFYNDAIKKYGDITYKINKLYCDKHNIDLIVSNEKRTTIDTLRGKDYH